MDNVTDTINMDVQYKTSAMGCAIQNCVQYKTSAMGCAIQNCVQYKTSAMHGVCNKKLVHAMGWAIQN